MLSRTHAASNVTSKGRTLEHCVRALQTSCGYWARPVKVPPRTLESTFPFYDPWFESSPRGTQPRTKAGSKFTITMIPGVGVGKELMDSVMELYECCGASVIPEWIINEPENNEDLNLMKLAVMRNGVAIKGNIEHRSTMKLVDGDMDSRNFLLLEALDLFVNVTQLRSFPSLRKHLKVYRDVDMTVIRSNTEGEFALLEHQTHPGAYEHLRVISAYNTRRVADFAFRTAILTKKKKVTLLHQSYTMPLSEGLFVDEFLRVANKYPDIEHQVMNVHQAIHMIHRDVTSLEVVISNSIYCTQVVNYLIGMIGGPQLVAGGSFSDSYAVFEPSVSSRSRKIAGKNEANPTAYLLCGAYVLSYLGFPDLAKLVLDAIDTAFCDGVMTKDLGGTATTQEFTRKIISHVQTIVPKVICKYDKPPKLNPQQPKDWAPEKSGLFFRGEKKGGDTSRTGEEAKGK